MCAPESRRFCHREKRVDKKLSQYKEWRKSMRKRQCGSNNSGILLYSFWYIYSVKDSNYTVHCVPWKHLSNLSKSRTLQRTPKQQFSHFTWPFSYWSFFLVAAILFSSPSGTFILNSRLCGTCGISTVNWAGNLYEAVSTEQGEWIFPSLLVYREILAYTELEKG